MIGLANLNGNNSDGFHDEGAAGQNEPGNVSNIVPLNTNIGRNNVRGSNNTSGDVLRPGGSNANPIPVVLPAHLTLQGRLSAFSPSAILSLLNIQKHTGWLILRHHGVTGRIGIYNGEVIDAQLGEENGITALYQIFGWSEEGEFAFSPGEVAHRTIEGSLPVLQLKATLWLDNWRRFKDIIPTMMHRITIDPRPAGDVVIEPSQWLVLIRIVSEPVTISQLAKALNQDVMGVAKVASELVQMGLATVLPPATEE